MEHLLLIAFLTGGYYAGKIIFGNNRVAGWIGVAVTIFLLFSLAQDNLPLFYGLIRIVFYISLISIVVRWVHSYSKTNKEIRAWRKADYPKTNPYKFSTDLTQAIYGSENEKNDIPYNRVAAFNDGNDILTENDGVIPVYYDAKPADNEMAFREFGTLITTKGVLYKKQVEDPKTKDSKNKSYIVETTILPFFNAYKVTFDEENDLLTIYYADRKKKTLNGCGNGKLVYNAFTTAINNGWSRDSEKILEKTWAAQAETLKDIDKVVKKAENDIKIQEANHLNTKSATLSLDQLSKLNEQFKVHQLNARFGASQGHGHAAEQANWVIDFFRGLNPSAEGYTNEASGADRVRQVSGEMIQTKYLNSAKNSVNNFFKKGYVHNGKMMTLEVPKDQYKEAVGLMRQKIADGQVPNETNPNNAVKYVKKGVLTYHQSKVAQLSIFDRNSTIKQGNQEIQVSFAEKLVFSAGTDFLTGAAAAAPMAIVNFAWIYLNNRWQGVDNNTARKNAMVGLAKPMLISGLMYTVASQFAGSKMGEKAVANLSQSLGKKVGRDVIAKRAMTTLTVVVAVGPDVVNCLVGRISFQQLIKNTAVTGTGMVVGGALGSAIPVVGTLVGSAIGGIVAKKILDHFSEDDSAIMARIAKEEFIEVVMFMPLDKDEFNDIAQTVFDPKEAPKLFKTMFQNGGRDPEGIEKSREFIDKTFENLVVSKFKERESFDDEVIEAVQDEFGSFKMAE